MKPIETERLILRNAREEDAEALFDARCSEFVNRFNVMEPLDAKAMRLAVCKDMDNEDSIYIELKKTRRAIGSISLHRDSLRYGVDALEISYWLSQSEAHQGYMSEALAALMEYAFDVKGCHRLSGRVFSVNTASRRLLEKLGFKQEGYLHQAVRAYKGIVYDDVLYSLSKEEYGQNKKRKAPMQNGKKDK